MPKDKIHMFVPPGGTTLWPRNVFFYKKKTFAGEKIKTKFGKSIYEKNHIRKRKIWNINLYTILEESNFWKANYVKMIYLYWIWRPTGPVDPFAHNCAKGWIWSGGHQMQLFMLNVQYDQFFEKSYVENPILSYASKRERANIAFNLKVKNGHCQTMRSTFFVLPGWTTLWPRNVFF